jgi:hypothetical protein
LERDMRVIRGSLFTGVLTICIGLVVRTEMLSRPQAASSSLKFEAASIKPLTAVPGMINGSGAAAGTTPLSTAPDLFKSDLAVVEFMGEI